MTNLAVASLVKATWETVTMVSVSSVVGILVGLLVGLVLFLSGKNQTIENKPLNAALSLIVNGGRSLPFIILLISITPLTQWLVGTTIGTAAAIIPLCLAAIPFYARVAESAFLEISSGLLETARSLGVNQWQLISKFLLPESLPALIKGATLTVISLIGYSAMAGAVGGGGLGQLAINYGYERFNVAVIVETVVILIVIVQLTQWFGDWLVRTRRFKCGGLVLGVIAALCIAPLIYTPSDDAQSVLKVGVLSGVNTTLLKVAQKVALKQSGLHIKIVEFSDYVQPNVALNNGSIDANIFQHVPYLNAQIKSHGYKLASIAKTFVYPFGFYSKKIHKLSQLKIGATIAIPNDPSNEGRALLLLKKAGLITLRSGVGLFPTPSDVISNGHQLKFVELDAAQVARSLDNVALGGLSNDYAKPAGFKPSQSVLLEGADSPYANVIAVRSADKTKPLFKSLIAAIHSKAYTQAVLKAFPDGAAIAAFTINQEHYHGKH